MKDKLKIFGMLAICVFSMYYIFSVFREKELENIEFINKDFKITKGIVTKKSMYKGNHLWVKYSIHDIEYVESDGFLESQKFNVGDTVKIKYSKTKPNLMITQFNDQF